MIDSNELLRPGYGSCRRSDGYSSDGIPEADRTRANCIGLQVAIAATTHEYGRARAAIDRAEREHLNSLRRGKSAVRPLDASLIEAGVSIRTANALEEFGVFTVADALDCAEEDLLRIPNFGPAALAELKACCSDWLGRPRTHVVKNEYARST
jgi:Bacterial RNA polymerase, alpha chain C terminal domain